MLAQKIREGAKLIPPAEGWGQAIRTRRSAWQDQEEDLPALLLEVEDMGEREMFFSELNENAAPILEYFNYAPGAGCALTMAAAACSAPLKETDPTRYSSVWLDFKIADDATTVLEQVCEETASEANKFVPSYIAEALWNDDPSMHDIRPHMRVKDAVIKMYDNWHLSPEEIADLLEAWEIG